MIGKVGKIGLVLNLKNFFFHGKIHHGKNDDGKLFSLYLIILAVKGLFLLK